MDKQTEIFNIHVFCIRPLTAPSSDQSLFRRPINHQKTIRPTTASTGPLR